MTKQELRTQSSVEAMKAILSNPMMVDDNGFYKINVAETAVLFAESLVDELLKEK